MSQKEQRDIYRDHAEEYDRLISAEDCDGRLLPSLAAITPLQDQIVLDVGTGTGRIARLLIAGARHILGVEPSPAMLDVARRHLQACGRQNFELHLGAAEQLPIAAAVADVAIAGWVFGHFRYWMPDDWQVSVQRAIDEMDRCVRPGGTVIIIETLGTGTSDPKPPSPQLAEYYGWLEGRGFVRSTVRTDYRFDDVETTATVCGFFFGPALADQIRAQRWSRVPECTGLWSRPQRSVPATRAGATPPRQ